MRIINIISIIILGCFWLSSVPALAQQIIAHRGASYLAPENTLASIKKGYALGADAVEIDIHLSADKRIMVNHDKDTKRTAGGKNLMIKNTNSEELRQLDVGSWKSEQYKGEKMPFLEEALAAVPKDKELVIEVKSSPEILPYLQQKIEESGIQEQLVLISFDKEVIVQAKQLMPAIPAYWLLHNYKNHSMKEAIQIAKENKLNGLDVHYELVDSAFMRKMKEEDLEVLVYTVNDPEVGKKMLASGVKGITTDRPQWLREKIWK